MVVLIVMQQGRMQRHLVGHVWIFGSAQVGQVSQVGPSGVRGGAKGHHGLQQYNIGRYFWPNILYCLVIEIMKFGMVWYGRKCEVEFKTLNQSIRYSAAVKVVKWRISSVCFWQHAFTNTQIALHLSKYVCVTVNNLFITGCSHKHIFMYFSVLFNKRCLVFPLWISVQLPLELLSRAGQC